MGGFDRFSRTIPRARLGGAASYKLKPLSGVRVGGPSSVRASATAAREASGYEAGYAQGLAEAQRQVQQERAAQLQRLDVVLARLQVALDEGLAQAADQVLELSFSIARQVLRSEIATRPDAVLPVVREALGLLSEAHGHPVVRLAPADCEVVRAAIGPESQHRGVRFLADPSIAPGGCRIEAPQLEVDATVAQRWRRVAQSLGSEASPPEEGDAAQGTSQPVESDPRA